MDRRTGKRRVASYKLKYFHEFILFLYSVPTSSYCTSKKNWGCVCAEKLKFCTKIEIGGGSLLYKAT